MSDFLFYTVHFENQNTCKTSTQCGQDNFYFFLSPWRENYYNILERSPYTESHFPSPHPHEEVMVSRTSKTCCNVALSLGPWMLSSVRQSLGVNGKRGGVWSRRGCSDSLLRLSYILKLMLMRH